MMACPECGSTDVVVRPYDFGVDPETGYHDAGERYRCQSCNATGPVEDLVRTNA